MFLFSIQLPLLAFDDHASELTGHTLVNPNLHNYDDSYKLSNSVFWQW